MSIVVQHSHYLLELFLESVHFFLNGLGQGMKLLNLRPLGLFVILEALNAGFAVYEDSVEIVPLSLEGTELGLHVL